MLMTITPPQRKLRPPFSPPSLSRSLIGYADPFSLANHRTFGHFVLWPLRALATSTSGHFELWPFQPLATSSSGHFNLWTFRPLALMNSPCLSLLATFGQFDLWTI